MTKNFQDTVLVIKSEKFEIYELYKHLSKIEADIKIMTNFSEVEKYLLDHPACVIISDFSKDITDPFYQIEIIKKKSPETVIVYVSTGVRLSDAVKAVKRGASDIFDLSLDLERITPEVNNLINQVALKRKNELSNNDSEQYMSNGIVFANEKMKAIISSIDQIAQSKATVLLLGESGVGKEVFAKMIHQKSKRMGNRFVVINCAAIPENLIESELFGHEKGSFTGANFKKIGKFEQAQQGTVFLDEMGELSLEMQVKFLRVLQEKQLERIGSSDSIDVDVRIIAATNKDLLKELENGKFREDLYYRLNVIKIYIPPLRERKEDILIMTSLFLKEFSKDYNKNLEFIDIEAMHTLLQHRWNGNVRELRNAIERATVVANKNEKILTLNHLPGEILKHEAFALGRNKTEFTLKEYEKMIIQYTLNQVKGNKTKAAEILNIRRQTLYYKIKEYGLIKSSWQE